MDTLSQNGDLSDRRIRTSVKELRRALKPRGIVDKIVGVKADRVVTAVLGKGL